MEPRVHRHRGVDHRGDAAQRPAQHAEIQHQRRQRPAHARAVDEHQRAEDGDDCGRNGDQIRGDLSQVLQPARLHEVHVEMMQIGEHHEQQHAVPGKGHELVALPGPLAVGGHHLVDHRDTQVHRDVHQHVPEVESQVLHQQRVARGPAPELLDGDQQQQHHRGHQARQHRDEADGGDDDDRRDAGIRAAQVRPAERLGEPVAARDRPEQVGRPNGPAHSQHTQSHEQEHRRPGRPRPAGVEGQGIQEIPADAEPAHQGRRDQQHDAQQRGTQREAGGAQANLHVAREQERDAGHAADEPEPHHAEAVERHDRVEPFGRQVGQQVRLRETHHEAEQRQDRKQHEGGQRPDHGQPGEGARVGGTIERCRGHGFPYFTSTTPRMRWWPRPQYSRHSTM